MGFLRDYAVSIIVVSIACTFLENILPAGNIKKYIKIVIGLLVMLVIAKPLTELPHFSDRFSFTLPVFNDSIAESERVSPYLAEQFETNLAQTVTEAVYERFKTSVSCRVYCKTNSDGQITDIEKLTLSPYTKEVAAFVSTTFGIKEASITS